MLPLLGETRELLVIVAVVILTDELLAGDLGLSCLARIWCRLMGCCSCCRSKG